MISFNETMQTLNYPVVTLGQNSPFTDFTATGGQWTRGVYVNDTWTGTADLTGAPSGQYTMKIIAADGGPNAMQFSVGPFGGNQIDSTGGTSGVYTPALT